MLADQTKHHKAHAEEGHAAPVIRVRFTPNLAIQATGKVMRGLSH